MLDDVARAGLGRSRASLGHCQPIMTSRKRCPPPPSDEVLRATQELVLKYLDHGPVKDLPTLIGQVRAALGGNTSGPVDQDPPVAPAAKPRPKKPPARLQST